MSVWNTSIDAQMATLSAIAYVDEGDTPQEICTAIDTELANPYYATAGQWTRTWGPAIVDQDNLVYAVSNGTDLAVVLRGTVFNSIDSWKEDLPTALEATDFPAAIPGKVSSKFKTAVFEMANATDPTSSTPLMTVVKACTGKIYVTGHSQGAGLAPLMHAYIAAMADIPLQRMESYTFAAPTTGDPTFAKYVDQNLISTRYYNVLDIVPTGYATMSDIWEKGLPIKATIDQDVIRGAVDLWSHETKLTQSDFAQPTSQAKPLNQGHTHVPGDTSYFTAVEGQHNHNTYLYLMGAVQTRVADPCPFGPTPA